MAVTPREQQVLDLHEDGIDPATIAARLGLAENYVRGRISYLSGVDDYGPRHRMAMATGSAQLLQALRAAGFAAA